MVTRVHTPHHQQLMACALICVRSTKVLVPTDLQESRNVKHSGLSSQIKGCKTCLSTQKAGTGGAFSRKCRLTTDQNPTWIKPHSGSFSSQEFWHQLERILTLYTLLSNRALPHPSLRSNQVPLAPPQHQLRQLSVISHAPSWVLLVAHFTGSGIS